MSNRIRAAVAAAVLGLTVGSIGLTPKAGAAEPGPKEKAPCAQQAAQLEKAEDALERLTAKFAEQKAAKDAKAGARGEVVKTKKAKKAQQQRVAKAEARLAACETAQSA